MLEWGVDEARKLLTEVADENVLDAYCKLLLEDGCPETEAADLLGGDEVLSRLMDCGMVQTWSHPRRVVPAPPDHALHGAIIDAERALLDKHRRVLTGHKRLNETSRPQSGTVRGYEDYVELVTEPEEIKRLSNSMMNLAKRNWMTLENLLQVVPMDEASCASPLPAFDGKVRCRSIYESRFLEIPVGLRIIEQATAAGEEARILPHLGMKLKLADEATALLPLTPTGMDGVLVVRSPTILGALREYFEMLWEKATPFGAADSENIAQLTPDQQRVLRLLAIGLLDEAIAHQLGVSVQTVRRHITAMREILDVGASRFAMGAAAVRRGWIS